MRFVFILTTLLALTAAADHAADISQLPKIRIVLVGDSTVTPTAGWGNGFIASLSDRAEVINLSSGGRSSMSFINEGKWKKALELKPDYVLIQFGHNDQKLEDPTRGTEPNTGYRRYMTQYVDEARAADIRPILVTSLSRRQWGPDGKIHSTLTPYVDVVKQIAKEKDVPLLDLHDDSIALYERLGRAKVDELSPLKPATTQPGSSAQPGPTMVLDGTHLNARGSKIIGRLVADELARAVPQLAPYVKPAATTAAATEPSSNGDL